MKQENKRVYIAGALLGLLAIASALATTWLLGKTAYLGASSTFVRAAGFIEQLFAPETASSLQYYISQKIKIDWQFMLVTGIAVGAFISSKANSTFKIEWVPPIWKERFGNSVLRRAAAAFIGGAIAMYGARLADGCPSGHGLSGMMQLSLSSLVALFMFIAMGALVAHLIYRVKGAVK